MVLRVIQMIVVDCDPRSANVEHIKIKINIYFFNLRSESLLNAQFFEE